MDPRLVERPAFTVIGYLDRNRPEEADWEAIWSQGFGPQQEMLSRFSPDGAYYGLSYPTEEEGVFDYVAGMAVSEVPDDLPDGLVVREIPAARYATVECDLTEIGATLNALFFEWLPGSPYEYDMRVPTFEWYPPEMGQGDTRVTLYMPVVEASAQ
jgi:predicted transcriptional regulator YdeE